MVKTSVKFQKNRNKTVGGVAHTRYILLQGDGRTDIWKDGKSKTMCLRFSSKPPLFFEKAGDKNRRSCDANSL